MFCNTNEVSENEKNCLKKTPTRIPIREKCDTKVKYKLKLNNTSIKRIATRNRYKRGCSSMKCHASLTISRTRIDDIKLPYGLFLKNDARPIWHRKQL
jgi:hypothetical protein